MARDTTPKKDRKGFKIETSTKILNVDLRFCDPNPDNKREMYGDIGWLTKSIEQDGIIQVLWGKRSRKDPKRFTIYDGNRRLYASEPLIKKKKFITADIRLVPPDYTMADIMKLQILVNAVKPFEAFENAKVIKSLLEEHAYTKISIRKEFNWTPQYVDSMIIFNQATPKIQKLVRQERLSLYELMRLYKDAQYEQDFDKIYEVLMEADKIRKEALKKSKGHTDATLFNPDEEENDEEEYSTEMITEPNPNYVEERLDRGEINESASAWKEPPGHNEPAPKRAKRESVKITKKHIDQVNAPEKPIKVNSFTELWQFMDENVGVEDPALTMNGQMLWNFANGLRENKYGKEDFENMFYGNTIPF